MSKELINNINIMR